MEDEWGHVTERSLKLTLQIIYLLTGETYEAVKKAPAAPMVSPCYSLNPDYWTPERKKKVLEATKRILHLLTGEVPIRCQDVTIHLSMEEWRYVEGHKELYKDAMMEDLQEVFSDLNTEEKTVPLKETLLKLILEAANLLAGESCDVVKKTSGDHNMVRRSSRLSTSLIKSQNSSSGSPPPSLIPERDQQKILEVNEKILGLLTREVPIRCEDVTLYLSMEEWRYVEEHKELYKDAMMGTRVPEVGHDVGETSENLRRHQKRHKKRKGEHPFTCSECGKCFGQKGTLHIHQRIHMGERPFSCSECGKCFLRKGALRIHYGTHTGECPFSCSECGKRFSEKGKLVRHQKSHVGEQPFLCTECGKCFGEKGTLLRHLRTHTGERPFLCSECGKCFSQNGSLLRHQMMHTGERPYACAECGRRFGEQAKLRRHQIVHTHKRLYSCSECEQCFTRKLALVNHKRTHTC